jgi:phosphatidylglycerophosphate synthase
LFALAEHWELFKLKLKANFVSGRRHIGVAEVRASFNSPSIEPISLAYFARPLANLITPFFFNMGITADQVIKLRLFIGLTALVLFALGGYWSSFAGLIAFALAYILDCVDGNISRLDDSGNYWGKFIDGYADDIVLFSTPFAIGIGLSSLNDSLTPLIIGGVATVIALLTGMARHRFGFIREWMISQTGPLDAKDIASIDRFESLRKNPVRLAMNLYCFAPWLILLPDDGWTYLGIMLIFTTGANLIWVATIVSQASALFRRSRKGLHAAQSVEEKRS